MKGFYAEMNVTNAFIAPENVGVDTKNEFIHESQMMRHR